VNVSLDCNNFTGELPADIVTLSQLRYLNVSTNSFSGVLPSGFSQLQMLQVCMYVCMYVWLACIRLLGLLM
jgi:hypothetical protein